jgi:NADPH-dependent 2,4-dienoyl-CoA reductase/sulfur reductase-like enzyme
MTTTTGPVLVVGTGTAGMATVEGLRRNGFDGHICWIGSEPHLPYDRPPLSKQILTGEWEPERIRLWTPAKAAEFDVELRTGTAVRAVDLPHKHVYLADGTRLPFGNLVAATGVTPRTLPGTNGAVGVHTVRTLDDTIALRAGLGPGRRLVVIGGGFLGTELAAAARTLGADVHLLEPEPTPLGAAVGTEVGTLVAQLHRDHGVDVRTGPDALVTNINIRHEAVTGVTLADGSTIHADLVVVTIGSVPTTGWLTGSGIDCSDGVRCNEFCEAAPGVYAAGDVASWHHTGFRTRIRLEHRTNTGEQRRYVARRILGLATEPFAPVPYFWSDQYNLKIQAYGLLRGHDEVRIIDGAVTDGEFIAIYRKGPRLIGALGSNKARAMRHWRSQIATGTLWNEIRNAA